MTHMERLKKMLCGQPVDRPLCAAWGHMMNLYDRDAKRFAEETILLQEATDFDFIKVMSNPYYLIEDTGIGLVPPKNEQDCITRSSKLPISVPADWEHLRLPRVGTGSLRREYEAILRIIDHYQGDTPIVATIFTPIMWMSYLAIQSTNMDKAESKYGSCTPIVQEYLIHNEKMVTPVLKQLSEINLEYMEALEKAGVSGFFYCTEHANSFWKSRELFEYFEGRYDLEALKAVRDESIFNILHVCGTHDLCMDYIIDYPVDAFNWEDQIPGNCSLGKMRARTDKVLVGGLRRLTDLKGDDISEVKDRLRQRLIDAENEAGDGFILSGGCDWKYEDCERLPLIRQAVESYRN